jgi:hypothetical protein
MQKESFFTPIYFVFWYTEDGIGTKKLYKKIQIRKKISNRNSTKYQKHEPIKILPGLVLQEARGVCVGPRRLQERLRGDVEYSSGPTLDGVVANTTVPGFRPCLVLLVNPIPRDKKNDK